MKLYATVKSERASKGQGGNEYLQITLQADAKERGIIGVIDMTLDDGEVVVDFTRPEGHTERLVCERLRGEQQ